MLMARRMRGFTLVEALVALLLLLAGLAGAGVVLLRSVQHERESTHRRAAIRLAGSLADELRAIHAEAAAPLAPDAPPIQAWSTAALAALPVGSEARVEVSTTMPVCYTITIAWPVAGLGMQRLVLPVTA
jgi:Tfp pilus assembly protein PilV